MAGTVYETFFRPDEIARERLSISARLYNRCRLLLSRCQQGHLFVPVRSMQFQSVIDRDEVIFVDSQAYAVRDGQGGRLIVLAWQFSHTEERGDLNQPAPIELIYYHENARQLHNRLIGEFAKELELLEQRARNVAWESRAKKVLPFPGRP